jgi:transcriptional regulator with XRE-family HTH domain
MAKAATKTAPSGLPAFKSRVTLIDAHVGKRVRQRRKLLGMSQDKLGKAMGLTVQQIRTYEHGINRVCASRLFTLSKVLDVPIKFFFDDMPDTLVTAGADHRKYSHFSVMFEGDPMARRETAELLRAYYRIEDKVMRRMLLEFLRSMSN